MHIQACSTLYHKCQKLIIDVIQEAQHTIHVMAYSLTAFPLIKALADAHQRGVVVQVIVHCSQLNASPLLYKLSEAGISLFNEKKFTVVHNKMMIIDQRTIITIFYNFTSSAEYRNTEHIFSFTALSLLFYT